MTLEKYMSSARLSGLEMAKRLDVTPTHVYDLMRGARGPSLYLARKIEVITGGKVRCSDWPVKK